MANQNNPLVSCVIPSYKRNDTVARAINSVLMQTYDNIEIIIVDDNNSGDEYSIQLKSLVDSFKNPKVKLLTQPCHINGAAARNYGINHAKGEFIAFLDDDDEWRPTKIEKQILFITVHPEYAGVSTLLSVVSNGKSLYDSQKYDTENLQFNVFLRKVGIQTSTFLARKSALIKMGAFDENLIRQQDLQLFVEFLEYFKIGLVPEVLTIHNADSVINRPNAENLVKYKAAFFDSVGKYLNKYSSKDQKRIKCNHNYEIAYVALKEKKIGMFLKYMFKSGFSYSSLKDLYQRFAKRH